MSAEKRKWRVALCLAVLFGIAIVAARVGAQAPGGTITAVNALKDLVTAKVNLTGQMFTFTLADKALLNRVRPGQGVFVNLGNKTVSLDGKSASGTIVTIFPLGSSANSGNTTPQPIAFSCGGTSNPLTADTCPKSLQPFPVVGAVSCGSLITITGNIYPAGSSDYLAFTVPTSRANCAMPVIAVNISSSPTGIVFDVYSNPTGTTVNASYGPSGQASGEFGTAGLGSNSGAPIQPGTYYIKIYSNGVYAPASTVGTWTLKIAG